VLFAVVIAPALKQALGGFRGGGLDYESFVAIATVGLLIPLNTMFAGIGVIVDRESGARRELLAAPVPRPLLVLGNLAVALSVTALQLTALPGPLAAFAKVLPLTHALTLMRYGLLDHSGAGLHDIWGLNNPTLMAALSLTVVGLFAAAFTAVSIAVFRRAAMR
jgi:hypothetical protein